MNIDYENELYLCIDCAKDSKLKKYILLHEPKEHVCSFCQTNQKTTLDIFDNPEFYNFLRALIRYHFWEDEYNRHFGGDDLYTLTQRSNLILNHDRIIENYLFEAINEYQYDDPNIVELYYGHDEHGNRLSFGKRYKDKRDIPLSWLEEKLLNENYFLFEEGVIKDMSTYLEYFESSIAKNDVFYRARIGFKDKVKNPDIAWDYTDEDSYNKYIPYSKSDIGAPPLTLTSAGRLNRQGVSFLYLATDINTALAEVRPHPGHKVSIGCFKSRQDLKIVDFDVAFIRLSKTENSLQKFIFLNHIDQLLSRPITPDERHLYIITQFFADIFRKMGFNGIQFSSSVGEGQNILIFDPSNFQYIDNQSNIYEIKSLQYSIKDLTL